MFLGFFFFFFAFVSSDGDVAVYNGPKCSAEVLSSVPNHRNAVMCLTEKICMSDKLW
jgi:hypothetical protein